MGFSFASVLRMRCSCIYLVIARSVSDEAIPFLLVFWIARWAFDLLAMTVRHLAFRQITLPQLLRARFRGA
jgi:hypothetical protein